MRGGATLAYQTSALYKEAIDKESRVTHIDGTLTTESGVVINITNDVIDQGSCYITNQCVSGDAFAYGSVFSAEVGITLKTEIDRYSLYGASLKLYFSILLSNGEYERIPLGVYFVNDPKRVGKHITIKAYDKMVELDESIVSSTTGTPFALLESISKSFGFELAQTEEEIKALPNGDKLLTVDPSMVGTYRDLLSYIGLITCTFACFDREGKLKLMSYGTEVSRIIQAKQRTSSSFSDFETTYSSATAEFLVDGTYVSYIQTKEETNGLMYEVGSVPLVQGTPTSNQETLDNLFEKLSLVKYTPCDITFNGDPSVDLGDKIKNVDRQGNEIISLVTYYKWSYRGRHQLKSAGGNPKLAKVKERTAKEIATLQTQIANKTIPVYSYTNSTAYKVCQDEMVIAVLKFSASDNASAILMVTANMSLDVDGVVEATVYLDGMPLSNSTVKQYCLEGNNVLTFANFIECEKGSRYELTIRAKTYYVESAIRVQKAQCETNANALKALTTSYQDVVTALKSAQEVPITSLSDVITYDEVIPSTAQPTMSIAKHDIKVLLFAQGLSAKGKWDGTIIITEDTVRFEIAPVPTYTMMNVLDGLMLDAVEPTPAIINEVFSRFAVTPPPEVDMYRVDEAFIAGDVVCTHTFSVSDASRYTFNKAYVTSEGAFKLNQLYEYTSTPAVIDQGSMCRLKIVTSDKVSIESVVVK